MKCVPPLALFAFVLVACGREPPVAPPPAQQALDVPKLDAGAPAPLSSHAHARGEVTVSFLTREGDVWGPWYAIAPNPPELVRPCYAQAIAGDPSLVGWATFDFAPGGSGARVELAEASPLPKALLVCIETALQRLHIKDNEGFTRLPTTLVYVTLR